MWCRNERLSIHLTIRSMASGAKTSLSDSFRYCARLCTLEAVVEFGEGDHCGVEIRGRLDIEPAEYC